MLLFLSKKGVGVDRKSGTRPVFMIFKISGSDVREDQLRACLCSEPVVFVCSNRPVGQYFE